MKILTNKYLNSYKAKIGNMKSKYDIFLLNSKELDFKYLTEISSVFSSNIEGNTLDINSFMNFRMNKNITKDVEEIENLIKGYSFAEKNKLNEKNLLKVHSISSETLLIKSKRGVYRNDKVGVFGKEGLIYLAIEAEYVEEKMKELFYDIENLINIDLDLEEIFYYASLIHLLFVHIHPLADGNGRCARLLEKWFLVEKLGIELWKIKSEEYYKENREYYYNNINLGVNYYELNYDNSIDFLLMLNNSFKK